MAESFDRPIRPAEAPALGQASLTCIDPRADDRRRSIRLSPQRVTIDRRLQGIAMRLSIPVTAYRGVCVALKPARSGGFFYEIRLAHRDEDLSVMLEEALDDRAIWAGWRAWAGFFGLPALVERSDGMQPLDPKLGAARPAATARRVRRRKRPGIVTRRVRNAGPAAIHREAEIIART